MANLKGVVSELRKQRTNLANQLGRIDAALAVLERLNGSNFHGRPQRKLSALARRKISLAQKARWAKSRSSAQSTPKRAMSPAARRKIAAAQRARWAKLKKAA